MKSDAVYTVSKNCRAIKEYKEGCVCFVSWGEEQRCEKGKEGIKGREDKVFLDSFNLDFFWQ